MSWRMVKVGLVAVLAILMIVLIAQNTDPVETRLVFVTITMPRAALLLVTLLVGVVFGIAIASRILPPKPAQVHERDVPPVKEGKESAKKVKESA